MWLVKLAIGIAVAYGAIVALVYGIQTWLIFPAGLAARGAPELPAAAERLELSTPDGTRLLGTHLSPSSAGDDEAAWLLGFGGNAWNADALALYLHQLFPDRHIATFHYRGYAPSTGSASARALLEDALRVHDHVVRHFAPPGIVAIGLSLGSGPAAHLAAERDIAGLILVTPFDSLESLARYHYPWAPVRPLLRHHMPIAEATARSNAYTAVVTAEHDTIVPAARAEPVARAARHLVLERMVRSVGHNDLYGSPDFAATMHEALRLIEREQSD